MTVFLDTAIFMYAAGAEHPLRASSRVLIERVRDRRLEAATSAEVVQEIIHRFVAIKRHSQGVAIARETLSLFRPVLPITDAVARRLPGLVERYPTLAARDLIHVATCIEEGIGSIVSPDTGFDAVSEIKRLDPSQAAA